MVKLFQSQQPKAPDSSPGNVTDQQALADFCRWLQEQDPDALLAWIKGK